MFKQTIGLALTAGLLAATAAAAQPSLSAETLKYVSVNAPVVALTHAKVVDGTGAAPKTNQTLVLQDGVIRAYGPDSAVQIPAGAKVIDATGKTVIPGLVHMHEHLFYPMQAGKAYGYEAETFTKLYLAGGVTSMRTAGAMHFAGDMYVRDAINAGRQPGPWIDVTGPYINAPGSVPQLMTIHTPEQAARAVDFYADQGATSFKAYTNLTRAELGAAIQAAHKRGLKLTGHLCSVTLREAADLGIDNIEHGFMAASDFKADKKPDVCPPGGGTSEAELAADPAKANALLDYLVAKKVAYTSTLSVRDTARYSPGIEVYAPDVRALFEDNRRQPKSSPDAPMPSALKQLVGFAKAFYDKGGLLLVGTDPTGGGGVVPGFANHHEIEALVEGGFTFEQALKASTMNGATYLGRADRIGSVAVGKQADLVLIDGDPSLRVKDINKVEIVFKQGVGYDPNKLIDAVRGKSGLY
jgi:imidazolonepropionase-like amidohydrolase